MRMNNFQVHNFQKPIYANEYNEWNFTNGKAVDGVAFEISAYENIPHQYSSLCDIYFNICSFWCAI